MINLPAICQYPPRYLSGSDIGWLKAFMSFGPLNLTATKILKFVGSILGLKVSPIKFN
jgi:hypothetical protein